MGIQANGMRCRRQDTGFIHLDASHLRYCQIHWNVYDRHVHTIQQNVHAEHHHHREGKCHKFLTPNLWCPHDCEPDSLLCPIHRLLQEGAQIRAQQRREREVRMRTVRNFYRNHQPVLTWQEVVDHILEHHNDLAFRDKRAIAVRYFVTNPEGGILDFDNYWRWALNGRHGPPPRIDFQPIPQLVLPAIVGRELANIAADRQNVHTRAVSEQTNKGLEKLLEEYEKYKQRPLRSPDWFASKWLPRSYGNWQKVSTIVNDMYRWYTLPTCRTQNDWLYKRALDGLYMMIRNGKDERLQSELYKRTFEECWESVGMCCDGHISRLCNVLVGFDEAFAPAIPFGEILQNKMAAIASQEIPTDEKIHQATTFFNEHAVPESERKAWLEAF